jgi:DNA-directed RNA polymerase specialized sigma24 family protein
MLEDIIPRSEVPTPEEILESRELQRYVARTLATLPCAWRRAFVLHVLDGLSLGEVARIIGIARSEAEQAVGYAREFLRQRLIEAGLSPDARAVQRVFGTVSTYNVPSAVVHAVDK